MIRNRCYRAAGLRAYCSSATRVSMPISALMLAMATIHRPLATRAAKITFPAPFCLHSPLLSAVFRPRLCFCFLFHFRIASAARDAAAARHAATRGPATRHGFHHRCAAEGITSLGRAITSFSGIAPRHLYFTTGPTIYVDAAILRATGHWPHDGISARLSFPGNTGFITAGPCHTPRPPVTHATAAPARFDAGARAKGLPHCSPGVAACSRERRRMLFTRLRG